MKRLTLVLPGIEGLAKLREGHAPLEADTPSWDLIKARGERQQLSVSGYESALFQVFGLPSAQPAIATLTVPEDLPAVAHNGVWLRADPVYLRADRDHLRFFDAHVLELEQAEAETLAGEITAIYADLGWRLHVAAPDRWYLSLDVEPDIRTFPPSEIVGRVVDPYLPAGSDGSRWNALMTEMQMVLHMSEVNVRRERAGRLPVNSVWFWGNGPRPDVPNIEAQVYADDAIGRALATAAGSTVCALDDSPPGLIGEQSETVIVDERLLRPSLYAESELWRAARDTLETRWIIPALAALRGRNIDELRIVGGNGEAWSLRRSYLWRFWRR